MKELLSFGEVIYEIRDEEQYGEVIEILRTQYPVYDNLSKCDFYEYPYITLHHINGYVDGKRCEFGKSKYTWISVGEFMERLEEQKIPSISQQFEEKVQKLTNVR